jgi:tRNA threonylcarbamoyladenosine biosynthesis protein TsaE
MTEASLRFRTSSEDETLRFGQTLGALLVPGTTVLLSGDLGTGKTVVVRGIGNFLGVTRVSSPSFTLINEYPTTGFVLVHVDLYRLEPGEVEYLGLEDYLDDSEECVMIVEWPERWQARPERDVLEIAVEAENENGRLFEVFSRGGTADAVFRKLREAVERGE